MSDTPTHMVSNEPTGWESYEASEAIGDEGVELAWIERWLSTARFAPYLAACSGSVSAALDLYLWNVKLCQVLMADISHFEVALRNAYDRVLRESWNGDD